jgi:hypothetical protein
VKDGDPVTTAARGGWCEGIYHENPKAAPPAGEEPWYARPAYWGGDFQITIVEVDDERTGHTTEHQVGMERLQRGLEVMAQKFPGWFGEIIDDNVDAACADVFLQCVVFGEEKYA